MRERERVGEWEIGRALRDSSSLRLSKYGKNSVETRAFRRRHAIKRSCLHPLNGMHTIADGPVASHRCTNARRANMKIESISHASRIPLPVNIPFADQTLCTNVSSQ